MRNLAPLLLILFAFGVQSGAQLAPVAAGSSNDGAYRQKPRVDVGRAVMLLIDKSGSMRDENRLRYAQDIAKAVARGLSDNDVFGVIGFDVDPFNVIPLGTLG